MTAFSLQQQSAKSPDVTNGALAAALEDVKRLRAASVQTEADCARKLQQAAADLALVMKEKDSISLKYSEKQKQLTAAAAEAEKEKSALNLKINELGAALKAAAAKEAKAAGSKSASSSAVEEDKNKTIASQSLRISQLESMIDVIL